MIARIATETALNKTFDYLVPKELEDRVLPGIRIRVPFGGRKIEGTVVELTETTTLDASKLKPIDEVIGGAPFISTAMLSLARWMSAYYLSPLETVLLTILPTAVRKAGAREAGARERLVVSIVPQNKVDKTAADKLTKRQAEVLDYIKRSDGGFLSGICHEWHVTPGVVRKIAELGFLEITSHPELHNPLAGRKFLPSTPLALSEEQAKAKQIILDETEQEHPKPVLLFGVTASGKTEVYLQAIAAVLDRGKGAIVLVPEISLTPQTIQRFASRFGGSVAVLHSQLSDGERHCEWHRIRSGEARVVVGPRSALFAPVENLGLIIVDEEHEPSYKQDESPRYNARDVAVMRGAFEKCAVVLGSATPSLESWLNAKNGKYVLAEMAKRVPGANPPATRIIDMRTNGMKDGIIQYFSADLVDAIKRRLECGEQVMLFLNRRGFSTSLVCPQCGHVEVCEDCDVSMTYHRGDDMLRCHMCSAFRKPPEKCPECGGDIKRKGLGTQRVEDIAGKLFPRARIERMDADVTARKYSHEEILARFRAREIDILIGTQMIAKGLDFPNVTLVGILNADSGLFIPDFRAGERTFQLIAQMSGRAGRGNAQGTVMVQTSGPDHPAIVCAKTEDYRKFAEDELKDRREAGFPPFTRIVCVTVRGSDEVEVTRQSVRLSTAIGDGDGTFYNTGDMPAPMSRIRGEYRHQFQLRTADMPKLLAIIRGALRAVPDPRGVRTVIDIDAINML